MDAAGRAAIGLLIAAIGCAASAGDDFQRGTELARSGRWEEARAAFLAGERGAPGDKRFPLELAGVEYRRKDFAAAKRHLRRALSIDPDDHYGNDFLGTLYYLDGNLDAALKYWNRIGKPKIEDVEFAPEGSIDPLLLDSALAFAPASLLTRDELRTTEARLDALALFPSYRIELAARPEEHFDAAIDGLKLPTWMQLASSLRGIAYQTVEPGWHNLNGSGLNWDALVRWDAQKRRAGMSLAGPLLHRAKWRYRWYADARSETWNSGGAEDFRLERLASGIDFEAIPSGRVSWHAGLEVSSRRLAGLPEFRGGTVLKYSAGVKYGLLRIPEHRVTVSSRVDTGLGRTLSGPGDRFWQGGGSIDVRWLPQSRGDDYEMDARVRGGTTQGVAPLDEQFMLGVERDNDLWLRGHAGTIGGKKGSAPIGRNYFLANWDIQKQIYRRSLFAIAAGPFVDTGRTDDLFGRNRFRGWLVDAGMEVSVRLAGALRISVIYGRDLRGGGRAIYATAGPGILAH